MSDIDILPYEEETIQILPVSIEQVVALSTNEEYISILPVSDAGDSVVISQEPSPADPFCCNGGTNQETITDSTILKNIDCDASVYIGSFVRINTSGIAVNAIADTYSNSNVIGLVESKSSSTKCDIRVSGVSLPIYSGLNADYDYFLSDTVAGLLTDTVPTTSGHIKIKLGQAFGTDKFVMAKGERVVRL